MSTKSTDNRLPAVLDAVKAMVDVSKSEAGARAMAAVMADQGVTPADLKGGGTFRKDAIAAWKVGVVGVQNMRTIAKRMKAGEKSHEITVTRVKLGRKGTAQEITARQLTTDAAAAIEKLSTYVRDALAGDKTGAARTDVKKAAVVVRCSRIADERDRFQKLTITQNDNLSKGDKSLLAEVGSVKKAGEIVAALNMALALFPASARKEAGASVPRADTPAKRRKPRKASKPRAKK